MAEEEKNKEPEVPEEVSTETDTESALETKAEETTAEEIDTAEEKSEAAVEVDAEAAAEEKSETAAKAESETAPPRKGPEDRRPGGPPGRGRGRPDYRAQNSGHGRPRRGYFRRKVCRLCVNKINAVDYKDVDLLRRFVTERGKIMTRRMTGTCAKHQRIVSAAVKRARTVALLPYVTK